MRNLCEVKEPFLYRSGEETHFLCNWGGFLTEDAFLGLFLKEGDPASKLAAFSRPNKRALQVAKYGYATIEATKKFFER